VTELVREVDGAVLAVAIDHDVDPEQVWLVRRLLSGYGRADAGVDARALVLGTPAGLSVVAEAAVPGFVDAIDVSPDYGLFALSTWIDAASLRFGTPGCLRLHAAAFSEGDRTWLVVGPSGAGKTTLAFEALGRGAAYLSEERVTLAVTPATDVPVVTGLARALRLRPGAEVPVAIAHDAFRRLLFVDQLGGGVRPGGSPVTDLVLLHEEPWERLDAGGMVRALMELSLNADRIGPSCLADLAVLVSSVQVHQVSARSLRSVAELDVTTAERVPVGHRWLDADEIRTAGAVPAVADGVWTLVIGRSCLIWVPGPPARVLQLSGEGRNLWEAHVTGASRRTEGVDPAVREAFLGDLVAAGALER
jgi:hypothetical protein